MRFGWAFIAVAACFRPTPPEGAPCAKGTDCPSPLMCDRGRCVSDPLLDDASTPNDELVGPDGEMIAPCVMRWHANTITTAPVNMTDINTTSFEMNPHVTADGNTLYFASNRGGNFDIYRATRTNNTFSNATPYTELNSPEDDGALTFASDGLTVMFASERPAVPLMRNYWQGTRNSPSEPFANFTTAPFANVNTDANDYELWLSPDGLRLYVSRGGGDQSIALATRTSTSGTFGTPVVISELASAGAECCHSLSADELVIVFASNRLTMMNSANELFYATRLSRTAPWGTARLIPGIMNNVGQDTHTFLSPDACTLYFSSTRTGAGGFDLWTSGIE